MFKFLKENRPVSMTKAKRLMGSIREDDNTPFRPIEVNADFGIIDGQHLFTACKILGFPIYYVQNKNASLRSIALLNQYMSAWGIANYAHFYAKQEKQQYIETLEFAKRHHVSVSLAICFLTMQWHGANVSGARASFKDGLFEITHKKEGEILLDELARFREKMGTGLEKDRDFYATYLQMRETIAFETWLQALEKKDWRIQPLGNRRAYLRQFEDILNFGKQTNLTRLY